MENPNNINEETAEDGQTETTETTEQETQKPSVVANAEKAAADLKEQNARMEANIKRLEELKASQLLGGNSDAGEENKKPKEETNADYAKRVMSGKI